MLFVALPLRLNIYRHFMRLYQMSLMSTLHPNIPITKNHHHVIAHTNICSSIQNKIKTSWSSSNLIIATPSFITTHTLNKRSASCATKQTTGSTTDMIKESDKKSNRGFWSPEWDWSNETNLFWFLGMPMLGACAPFAYDEGAIWVSLVLFYMSGFGLTLGYHRLLSHRGFKVPKWIEYFIVYCGAHAIQRDPMFWVSAHKLHHKYSDTKMDPYTPTQGVWCSCLGWFIYNDYIATKCKEQPDVSDLKAQWFYRFLQDTYFWHPTVFAILLYLYGGFPYLVWVMGVRITALYLLTFIPFFVIHKWGERAYNTPDTSTNSWWVSLLCLGDGWHNNHHAFPRSARHGLEWWQLDLTWEMIKFLEVVGLATDVKVPKETDKRRMASLGSTKQR